MSQSYTNEDTGPERLTFVVDEQTAGQRADKALSTLRAGLSRARLQRLIADGQVQINNKNLKAASRKVEIGDVLEVVVPDVVPCEPQPEDIALDIVYEDEHLLVINKSAGLVVHPGAGNWSGTLVNALLYHCKDSLSGIGGVVRPGIVHRLDKDTSGLIMVAKNDHAHHHLAAQLADRSLSRVYEALVLGVPVPIKGMIDKPLGRDRGNRLRMSVISRNASVNGKEARTRYLVLKTFGEACAHVECKLETGRTHQIRVHMEALGHPLVGDQLYGPQPTALKAKLKRAGYDEQVIQMFMSFPRQMLHAKQLKFIHPVSEVEMSFEAPAPEDFSKMLKLLIN